MWVSISIWISLVSLCMYKYVVITSLTRYTNLITSKTRSRSQGGGIKECKDFIRSFSCP